MRSSHRKTGSLLAAALITFGFGALPLACSSADSGNGLTAGGGGGGAGNNGTGAQSGGGGKGGGSGGGLIIDSGVGGGVSEAGTCEAFAQKADLVPLDLYVMLDKSGSMQTSGWDPVTKALQSFVQDSASTGLGIGLQYFPGSPECMPDTYANPAVPIGLLPAIAPSISSSLSTAVPGGQTPTLPALQGALQYVFKHLVLNPTHSGVVVLATDGIPNDCASTVDKVAQEAANAVNDNPKILTFVIGVGKELTALDQIALSGGTQKAFLVDTTANVTQQFIDALNSIRGGAIACEYLIPTPEAGTIDPGKVNVSYKAGGTGDPETFPNVGSASKCPASGDGWYYDNPTAPTKVILCPSSCDKVKADSKAEIGVAFGCKTKIA